MRSWRMLTPKIFPGGNGRGFARFHSAHCGLFLLFAVQKPEFWQWKRPVRPDRPALSLADQATVLGFASAYRDSCLFLLDLYDDGVCDLCPFGKCVFFGKLCTARPIHPKPALSSYSFSFHPLGAQKIPLCAAKYI